MIAWVSIVTQPPSVFSFSSVVSHQSLVLPLQVGKLSEEMVLSGAKCFPFLFFQTGFLKDHTKKYDLAFVIGGAMMIIASYFHIAVAAVPPEREEEEEERSKKVAV